MTIVPAEEYLADHEDVFHAEFPAEYVAWRDGEGVPVYEELFVEDLYGLETGDWDRTGERGAIVNFHGSQGLNDVQLQELTPGGRTDRQHHFYEELVYVAEGTGATVIGDEDETTFEWSEGALFYIPRATPFRHVNLDPDDRALLLASTPLPLQLFLNKSEEFVFDPGLNYWAEMEAADFYAADGTIYSGEYPGPGYHREKPALWDSNFVPDVFQFDKLSTDRSSGVRYSNVHFPMPDSSMYCHVGEFPVGTYKMAHRHCPGAHLLFITGEGYSLMWFEGMEEKLRFDWGPGSMIVPPTGWFHHHFNTSDAPARDLVWHAPELHMFQSRMLKVENPANTLEHAQEDAEIRETFEAELAAKGMESDMPQAAYRDADYEADGGGDGGLPDGGPDEDS
jgi:uncharacterized RmlC-like cupin family protein